VRGVAVCRPLSPSAGASVLTIVAFSPPRGTSVPPALVEQRRLPTTISLSKLNHAALALAVYASQLSFPRSRGRTATQDSLPAGGQPLPGGGHDPARSQMKFQPRLPSFLLIQAFATQSTSEFGGFSVPRKLPSAYRSCGVDLNPSCGDAIDSRSCQFCDNRA
jgi:hypothetical protein